MTLSEIINQYIKSHGLTQREFSEKSGLSPSYIVMLKKNLNSKNQKPIRPTIETYNALASAMGMTVDELFEKMDNAPIETRVRRGLDIIQMDSLAHHRIPLIGSVAGGQPIYDEDIDLYIEGPTKASCAVRLRGDSMEPTYMDGDIIYVREQPDVRDGQVAIVFLDDEAVLKRVYHIPNGLQLISDNNQYKPITATIGTYDSIRILGIPCGYTRMYDNNVEL